MTVATRIFGGMLVGTAALVASANESHAQSFGFGGYFHSPRYVTPHHGYHLDYQYHPEYSHWTPLRGLHTHGHYDAVPHYSHGYPGHHPYHHHHHGWH